MLRCRVLSSPTWKVGKRSWQYTKRARFSNSPSRRLPPTLENGHSASADQSALKPDALIGTESPLGAVRESSAQWRSSSNPSNDTYSPIPEAEQDQGESKSATTTDKTIDTLQKATDNTELPLNSKAAENLLQKLVELRSASRDILAVATSALKLAANGPRQETSTSISQQQDGTTSWLLGEMGSTAPQAASSSDKGVKHVEKKAGGRKRKARRAAKGKDGGPVIARKIAHDSNKTLIRRTLSKKEKKESLSAVKKAKSAESATKETTTSSKKSSAKDVKSAGSPAKKTTTSSKKVEKPSTKDVKSALLSARQLRIDSLDAPEQPPVKTLSYDLDRVLFKQGVYNLQDPRTGVFNFDHYLQNIMPAEEFDFDSLATFMASSEDSTLQNMAKQNGKRYVGSTSSMTSVLSHFHFLLSNFRPLALGRISRAYPKPLSTFTEFTRIPTSFFLRYKDDVYAVDSDKEFDRATILSRLGQSLEKLLTVPRDLYEQYRKTSPEKIPEEVKNAPEAYHYSGLANFVFRSQLDGRHDWLPGTGIFDIKTRACVTIRMDQDNYKQMSGYQIRELYGEWESYEREYLDMLRSTMLKYSLQVRMGRMDGIFVAYHNTEQIFGFQYVPLSEMDLAIHGQENLALGDQEFNFSMQMFSDVLDLVTEQFPRQSVRFHFETRPRSNGPPEMYVFAELMDSETMDTVRQAETEIAIQELRDEMLSDSLLAQGKITSDQSPGSEDQNEDDHAEEIDITHESSQDSFVEELQESETLSTTAEPQDVELEPSADESVLAEELEADAEAESEIADPADDFVDLEKLDAEFQQEAVSNDETMQPDPVAQDVEETSSANQPIDEDEDVLSTETASEHLPQTAPVLDEKNPNGSQNGRRPLLGFSLTVSHFVNGDAVQAEPSIKYQSEWPIQQAQYRKGKRINAPPVDKTWNVSYNIRQFSDGDARKLYMACQARKRKKFESLDQRDEYRDKYVRMMRAWSERGRSQKNKAEKVFSKDIKQVTP